LTTSGVTSLEEKRERPPRPRAGGAWGVSLAGLAAEAARCGAVSSPEAAASGRM
jgi:hypothetical protein